MARLIGCMLLQLQLRRWLLLLLLLLLAATSRSICAFFRRHVDVRNVRVQLHVKSFGSVSPVRLRQGGRLLYGLFCRCR
jgi:hypothetical protein